MATTDPSPAPGAPDVFAYLDYRAFLRDYYSHGRAVSRLSYRGFSRRVGLGSPNFLKLVSEGQRNLTMPMAARFATACGLKGRPAEYFVALVALCQAKTPHQREAEYRQLHRFARYRSVHHLSTAQDAYHSTWYLPAIRELVGTSGFREDPAWIANQLLPSIRPAQAETAVDSLLELGLLERDADGNLRQAQGILSTGADQVRSLHLRRFHRTMMEHASSSLDRLPAAERDISGVTLQLGPGGLLRVKQRMQELRRELLDMAEQDGAPTQVVHVGMQVFPLSKNESVAEVPEEET